MSSRSHLEELTRIRERVNRLFEQALAGSCAGDPEAEVPGGWVPVVDVVETPQRYLLYAELPGVGREDIHLEVTGRRLELSGRRRPPRLEGRYERMERGHGPFRRVFELDQRIDADGVDAKLRDGVLRIDLPKSGG